MKVPSKILRAAKNEDERKALQASFISADLYRQRVLEIMRVRINVLRSKQDNDDYSSPCWSERQAALNAAVREVNSFKELLGEAHEEAKEE